MKRYLEYFSLTFLVVVIDLCGGLARYTKMSFWRLNAVDIFLISDVAAGSVSSKRSSVYYSLITSTSFSIRHLEAKYGSEILGVSNHYRLV